MENRAVFCWTRNRKKDQRVKGEKIKDQQTKRSKVFHPLRSKRQNISVAVYQPAAIPRVAVVQVQVLDLSCSEFQIKVVDLSCYHVQNEIFPSLYYNSIYI